MFVIHSIKVWVTGKKYPGNNKDLAASILGGSKTGCSCNFHDRNTRKKCEIYSKLPINNKNVNDVVLVFLLLTLNIFHTFF